MRNRQERKNLMKMIWKNAEGKEEQKKKQC